MKPIQHYNNNVVVNSGTRTWSVKVTFPQFPGIYVRFAEISDPAGIKLLVRLHLAMGVTSGGQWSWKT